MQLTTLQLDELAQRVRQRGSCGASWIASVCSQQPPDAAEDCREVLRELGVEPSEWLYDPDTQTVTAVYHLPVYCFLPPYDRLADVRQLRMDWERQVGESHYARAFREYFLARCEDIERRSVDAILPELTEERATRHVE